MTDEKEKQGPEPAHVFWLVENRTATQQAAAHLYRLLTEHKDKLVYPLDDDAQLLTGVSFALWRSVFLAGDEEGDKNSNAIAVLGEVLQSNAITYPFEFKNRAWSFRFYSNNAWYRLGQFAQKYTIEPMQKLLEPRKLSPKETCKMLQGAFELAIANFEKRLVTPK